MSEPKAIDLVAELRKAVGLFDGALPISPKEAWEEALSHVRYQRELASIAVRGRHSVDGVKEPSAPARSWVGVPEKGETT